MFNSLSNFSHKVYRNVLAPLGVVVALFAGFIAVNQYIESREMSALSGTWELTHEIKDGPYAPMRMVFLLSLGQSESGQSCTGGGDKVKVDEVPIPSVEKSRLNLTSCKLAANKEIHVTYSEKGSVRESGGRIVWRRDADRLIGRFYHSTGSSGISRAVRIKDGN